MEKEIVVQTTRSGIGFWGLLTIVLIILKLTGTAQISWWVIVACMFAPLIIIIGFFLMMGCFAILAAIIAGIAQSFNQGRR
ncbi:MAG: hypothetical protein WC511_01775 [Candidatus Pacearchaeota archaeon]